MEHFENRTEAKNLRMQNWPTHRPNPHNNHHMPHQALINITGKVQGVGYRLSALREAKELGLKGYVRNMPNGSVEILAQGEKEKILKFAQWCKEGPSAAEVTHIKINWSEYADRHNDFKII